MSCDGCRSKEAGRTLKGFSLVEIMIVIVIIGLLAGVVTFNVRGYINRANQARVKADISQIVTAVDDFWAENKRYPTNEEGIAILSTPSEKHPDPYLNKEPVDPWGQPYQYNSPGAKGPYEIICLGADGREGGTGADADISSDDLK